MATIPASGMENVRSLQKSPAPRPGLCQAAGGSLGVALRPIVSKVRDNDPQKAQQNGYYRCRNLDGVFDIKIPVPEGPVLLVDDVVDSGWTLTVIAALLRQAGSGAVWPLALATSGIGA